MPAGVSTRRTCALLFGLACAVNLGALFASHPSADPATLDADAREYFELAGRVVDGTYTFDSRRVLGHVLILAAFRVFTGANLVALRMLVTLLFSTSAPLAYRLARRFTAREPVAVTVGAVTAVWPLFVSYGRTLYSETTALPVFLCFLASLPVEPAGDARALIARPWRWLASGALLGVCMLVRPMYLLFTPFVPLVVGLEIGRPVKAARAVGWIALGCALAIAPWSAYASANAGRPLLLSANGGETLAGGLNPTLMEQGYRVFIAPDGRRTWTGPGKWLPETQTGYLSPGEQALPRFERDRLLRERTSAWIAANPGSALYLEAAKLGYMWGVYPFWNGAAQTLLGNVPTILVELAGVLALVRLRRAWRRLALLWALPIFTSAVALVSWGSWRFREPADIGLIALGVLFVWSRIDPARPVLRG